MSPITRVGHNCFTIQPVSEAGLLVDGENYYTAFCKAARTARKTLCITGWQFDTQAIVNRCDETAPATFLAFLNHLCEQNPELHVYITAWNYSMVYALEREWFQNVRFAVNAHERVHFRFLEHPTPGGSHHQKIVIVDDRFAFTGGLDVCDERWDTRAHQSSNPERRNAHGTAYGPFHDVQVVVTGEAVQSLLEQFWRSWDLASGEDERPPEATVTTDNQVSGRSGETSVSALGDGVLPIRASHVAVSRTRPKGAGDDEDHFEVEALFRDAICAAEDTIYVENQYFTSQSFVQALIARMIEADRSKLKLVFVLPEGGHSKKEAFVIGTRQHVMLWLVLEFARAYGHEARILKSCARTLNGERIATFIHSKVLIVDDRFLCVGSANLMNRSMRVDHELNLSFDAGLCDGEQAEALRQDIRAIRCSLLAEHAGLEEPNRFECLDSLVDTVDELCADLFSKLQLQSVDPPTADDPVRAAVFDPNGPIDWTSLTTALEASFSQSELPAQNTARKIGQRLGVVDIPRQSA